MPWPSILAWGPALPSWTLDQAYAGKWDGPRCLFNVHWLLLGVGGWHFFVLIICIV
jgi:hypothetical protein